MSARSSRSSSPVVSVWSAAGFCVASVAGASVGFAGVGAGVGESGGGGAAGIGAGVAASASRASSAA